LERGVLIVDDSKAVREMVRDVLAREGLFGNFYEAGNGEEAIEALKSGSCIDLVLMDLIMPKVDGIKLISWIRGTNSCRDLPILVLSVEGRGEMKAKGLNLGASDYVVKPFDEGELVARIKLLLKRKDVQDDLKRKNVELVKINEELKKLAVTDELTQLFNRSYFLEQLSTEMNRSVRYKVPMTLLMVDLDNFKKVNDTFGHLAGDEVLKDVAAILPQCVRESDVVGRYGGEEFVICLVHTDKDAAMVPAERVRSSVADKVYAFSEGTFRTTASIGVVYFGGDPTVGRDELIKRADAALYRAKADGKNRIVVYE